jgi:hypothetical protein
MPLLGGILCRAEAISFLNKGPKHWHLQNRGCRVHAVVRLRGGRPRQPCRAASIPTKH